MFDWLFGSSPSWASVVQPPIPPPVEPLNLPYDSAHVLLHGQPDVPFHNDYWDYPLRGPGSPEIIYSEKMTHAPIFSSKHQLVNGACMGKLHFTKSTHPESIALDTKTGALLLKPRGYVVTSALPSQDKCGSVESGGAIPVNYRIGGSGPGGPEMSFHGSLSSKWYQKFGPHYLGTQLKDGSLCVEPSAVEMRPNVVYTINGDEESVRESIIKTS